MQQILKNSLPSTPRLLLLGDLKYWKKYAELSANRLTAATQVIAETWKSDIVLSIDDCLYKVKHVSFLSKLSALNQCDRLGQLQAH